MASLLSPQLRRLLSYVRPYAFRLSLGVVLVAFVALAEGMVAFMVKIAVDYVLNPSVFVTKPVLFTLPGNRVIYLNDFLPSSLHNVATLFAVALPALYLAKALAEYLGITQIQYVGQAAVTDLRNQVYAKIIRQPIAFFQHNPVGRLLSATINDVERTRVALSEYLADLFQKRASVSSFSSACSFGLTGKWRSPLPCSSRLSSFPSANLVARSAVPRKTARPVLPT